jgi:hypothetical protein
MNAFAKSTPVTHVSCTCPKPNQHQLAAALTFYKDGPRLWAPYQRIEHGVEIHPDARGEMIREEYAVSLPASRIHGPYGPLDVVQRRDGQWYVKMLLGSVIYRLYFLEGVQSWLSDETDPSKVDSSFFYDIGGEEYVFGTEEAARAAAESLIDGTWRDRDELWMPRCCPHGEYLF